MAAYTPLKPEVVAPLAIEEPFGNKIDFPQLVELAKLPLVVSGESVMPYVWLHDRDEHDYIVRRGGLLPFCVVSVRDVGENFEGYREVVRRLAYGFEDYAALEVVERHNRDCEREIERRKKIMKEGGDRARAAWQKVEDEHVAKIAAAVPDGKIVSKGVIGVDDPTERPSGRELDPDEGGFKP